MITNPFIGTIIALITFPGVILHEIAHRFFCDITKTPVYEIKYIGISTPPLGYVAREQVYGLWKNTLISLGPFIVNNVTAFFVAMPYGIIIGLGAGSVFAPVHILLLIFLMWLGFSCAYNSFPSSVDVSNLTEYIDKNHSIFTQILYFPFRLIFFVQRILSVFWFDAIWALGIIIGQVYIWGLILK